MLQRFLTWFRKDRPEPDEIAREKWSTSFSILDKKRFLEETRENFDAFHSGGAFHLSLKRSNLFAWSLHGPYRYRNAVVEMTIGVDPDNGHCAAGMMLRYMSEYNYYYALVSGSGQFRFDVVLNGNPICLIPWLDIEEFPDGHTFTLRAIMHHSSFSFYLNDVWIAELDDESISAGYFAFCAQNYDEAGSAGFMLNSMKIESRPVEVDILYYRWTRFIPAPYARRLALAERLNGMGQHAAALVQLRKAFKTAEPDVDAHFLLAETCLSLEMYDEALRHIEECLSMDPDHREAQLEKANILYLQNRFYETRTYLNTVLADFEDFSSAWNLMGNAEYALGNWIAAADSYQKAVGLEAEMPIFHLNAAHSFDKAGDLKNAETHYTEAARLFFRQDAYDDLPPVFGRLREIAPRNPVYLTVYSKTLFGEGDFDEAEKIFLELIGTGSAESEIHFLEGLVQTQRGNHTAALEYFDSALADQPDFYLYWLKKAESEYYTGRNPDDSLEKARSLQPGDGWIHNLTGLVHLERNEMQSAVDELEEAVRILPGEEEIRINLSEALARLRGIDAALPVLSEDRGASLNQAGNLYAREGMLDEAIDRYRSAVQKDPEEPVFRENLAAALWEAGLINEAEENLARLLEEHPGPRAYELIGQVAFEKGQYSRAVAAWEAAVELDRGSDRLHLLLARGLMHAGELERAGKKAEELADGPQGAAATAISNRIREITHIRYFCDECGREWWVPKDIPPQKQLKLVGEPPAEMPAGKCPECGRVYCVGCASGHLKGSRFVCAHCEKGLKLLDDGLKYLALQFVELEKKS